MVLISKWMGLARTEHPPWTGPFVMPDRHALVETYDPGCDKGVGHVLVPSTNHLADLPKLVNKIGRNLFFVMKSLKL